MTLSPALLTGYFPISGEEIDQPSPIYDLVLELQQNGQQKCLAKKGWKTPGYFGNGPTHLEDYPDLQYIDQHGFTIVSPVPASLIDAEANLTGSAEAAFQRDTALCGNLSPSPAVSNFESLVTPLSNEFMGETEGVQSDPSVLNAYKGFVSCLRNNAIDVSSEDAFFDYDQMVTNAGDPNGTDESARLLQIAHIYVRCITPVETIRVKLRSSLRETFIDQNEAALQQVQLAANGLLARNAPPVSEATAAP